MDKRTRGEGWGVIDWKEWAHPHDSLARVVYVVLAIVALALLGIWGTLLVRVVWSVVDFEHAIPIKTADDLNKVLLGLGGIIGATTGVPFLVWRTLISQHQNEIAQENLHSTTMAKAIEQLGATKEEKLSVLAQKFNPKDQHKETQANTKPNLEVRLGAIYLLEKLARDNKELHWPIMEILCAYIRQNAGPPKEDANDPPRVDVQAALTVIGRRSPKQIFWEKSIRDTSHDPTGYRLDLSNCHLARANFHGLNFNRGNFKNSNMAMGMFRGAWLSGAIFSDMNLRGSWLLGAHLEGAVFSQVNLINVQFFKCHMEGVYFCDASIDAPPLENTFFNHSKFDEICLNHANLKGAIGIDASMLEVAWGDSATILPEGLERPNNDRWHTGDIWEPRHDWFERQKFWLDEAQRRWDRELAERSSR